MKRRVWLDLAPEGADPGVSGWTVEGKSVLEWQMDFFSRQDVEAKALEPGKRGSVPSEDLVLPVHWVFDKVGFQKVLASRRLPEAAVLWRIRTREDLPAACSEWVRNDWLPFRTDYIKHAAHAVAARAAATPLTPNQLTLGTLACALAVLWMLAFDVPGWSWVAPPLILFAVVLDFADGRLARLKNAGSEYGAYLDSTVGDLTEDLCYLGLIAHLYFHRPDLGPAGLIAGVLYFFGKYQAYLSLVYQNRYIHAPAAASGEGVAKPLSAGNPLARAFVVFEFTVLRYHFLALFLLLKMPEVPLFFYAFHFNARWALRVALVTLRQWGKK